MDTVAFISTTTSKKGDLILSFAIEDARWPGAIRSLVLLRCPRTDEIFDEDERGITVSMEGQRENTSDLRGRLLSEFSVNTSANAASVKTPTRSFDLNLSKLTPADLTNLREFLAQMNFDGKAKVSWD